MTWLFCATDHLTRSDEEVPEIRAFMIDLFLMTLSDTVLENLRCKKKKKKAAQNQRHYLLNFFTV